ncbi:MULTISPECIES: hypothetical protein [unclassified Streptomyces]|uniref:hypothetical protein n=1 Tax=unclassified Streptomyces TaxID=2593676 RepID=UPI0035E1BF28
MSVTIDEPGNTPGTTPDAVHITINQHPDGRISSVTIDNERTQPENVWMDCPRATVWTAQNPQFAAPLPAPEIAWKVLDLAVESGYQDDDEVNWPEGERDEIAFHGNHTGEYAQLRTVEAHLIRLGVVNAHTGVVACQTFGLTLDGEREHFTFCDSDGWRVAMDDRMEAYDYTFPGVVAPLSASPRRVAHAIVSHLLEIHQLDPTDLNPLRRTYARFTIWRTAPHWQNFTYRARRFMNRHFRTSVRFR